MENSNDIHQLIQQVSRLATQMEAINPVIENQMRGLTDINNRQIIMGQQVLTNINEITDIRKEIRAVENESREELKEAIKKSDEKNKEWQEEHKKVHSDGVLTTRYIITTGLGLIAVIMSVIVFMLDRLINK